MLLKSNTMLESTLTFIVLSFKDRRFLTRRANGVREDWDKRLQRRCGNESTSFVDEAYDVALVLEKHFLAGVFGELKTQDKISIKFAGSKSFLRFSLLGS